MAQPATGSMDGLRAIEHLTDIVLGHETVSSGHARSARNRLANPALRLRCGNAGYNFLSGQEGVMQCGDYSLAH